MAGRPRDPAVEPSRAVRDHVANAHATTFVQQVFLTISPVVVSSVARVAASVKIASYNSHLTLLKSEHCWGEHRTVYSGHREAVIVVTSTGEVGTNGLIRSLQQNVRSVAFPTRSWRLQTTCGQLR